MEQKISLINYWKLVKFFYNHTCLKKIFYLETNLRQLGRLKPIPDIFYPGIVYGIEDDHIPFLKRGNKLLKFLLIL